MEFEQKKFNNLEEENAYLISLLKKVYHIRAITNLTPIQKRRIFENQIKCADAVNGIWDEVDTFLKKYNEK